MLALLFFRRYGFVAPLSVIATGALLQLVLDAKYGTDYFVEHFWALGLCLLTSGMVTGAVVYLVDPPTSSSGGGGGGGLYANLDTGAFLPKATQDVRESCAGCFGTARDFVAQPSEDDHFCYVPLNWCAAGLVGLGTLLVAAGLFQQ